ncbi:UNVERIFIED_CONTAM: hypothetical protein Scaly_2673800 [Sesamum calycinum]|uniref:Uncharacterized protein n=1 Tax=Sesamum calycinum TaxID=2727403 RepID=A0AAW2J7G3_9LAMI
MSTIMQIPARFGGVGNFGASEMHVRNLSNRISGDLQCTSSREQPKESDLISLHKDGVANMHKLRIDSVDKNRFILHHGGKNIQTPASRIVGFEPNLQINHADQSEDKQSGEHLEIGSTLTHSNLHLRGGGYSINLKENKKAHVGDLDYGSPIWSTPTFASNSPPEEDRETNSSIITDGPLLENHKHGSQNHLSSYHGFTFSRGTTESPTSNGAINILRDSVVSPPLSLSPLGPRFCGRMRQSRVCWDSKREFDEGYITFKDVEQSLEGTISSFWSSHKDENVIIARKGLEDENFGMNFEQLTPECLTPTQGHNPTLTAQNTKLGRTLGGLSVRRSLVGSFEESLLSGRLASGIVSQTFLRQRTTLAMDKSGQKDLGISASADSLQQKTLFSGTCGADAHSVVDNNCRNVNRIDNIPLSLSGGKESKSLCSPSKVAVNNSGLLPLPGRSPLLLV